MHGSNSVLSVVKLFEPIPQHEALVMARVSTSTAKPITRRSNAKGVTLIFLVLIILARGCEAFVVRPRSGTPTGASSPRRVRGCRSNSAKSHTAVQWGLWGASLWWDNLTAACSSPRRKTGLDASVGANSGADMGFDLTSELGARMGSFIDGEWQ